jgi:hypothetical protein
MTTCYLHEHFLPSGHRAVTLENELLSVTLLPDKGADIYTLIFKPRDMDVLWKSPTSLKRRTVGVETSTGNSQVSWLDHYEGGWQEIFPNGGSSCSYKGALLTFHGEASTSAWDYRVVSNSGTKIVVEFTVNLARSPFTLTRNVTIESKLPSVILEEKVTNCAQEEMHYMWGHHPAFGAPFLGADCRLHIPSRRIETDEAEMSASRFHPGASDSWPVVKAKDGSNIDMSVIPPDNTRISELHYISGLEDGWYGVSSPAHNFGFGLIWPKDVFPYLWYWLELKGSSAYPWYGRAYVVALEPFTSIPGSGLEKAIENGTAPLLGPDQTIEARLVATFFEHADEIHSISVEGVAS